MEPHHYRNSIRVHLAPGSIAKNVQDYDTGQCPDAEDVNLTKSRRRAAKFRASVRISTSHSSDDLLSLGSPHSDTMTPPVSFDFATGISGTTSPPFSPAPTSPDQFSSSLSPTLEKNAEHLWVFGYGSILWKTGFRYSRRKFGYVQGYVRRFWQGNTTHRGSQEAPGRVATLVEDQQGVVWGAAYELRGEEMVCDALDHLGMRECKLGGYAIQMVPFFAKDNDKDAIPVLMFNATSTNSLYMGPSSLTELANQIITCKGNSGHNVEYVTKLADFIRKYIPEDRDMHLFKLDMLIRTKLLKSEVCLRTLEGTRRRMGSESADQVQDKVIPRRKVGRHSAYRNFGRQPSFLDTIGEVFVNQDLTDLTEVAEP